MGGWKERRIYRVTDRSNLKYDFKLCNLFSGRSLVLEGSYILNVFQLHLKILLLLPSGVDDDGVCCKVVAESFVDFIRVLVFDFTIVIKVRWWW